MPPPPNSRELGDYFLALALLTLPTFACISVVAICVFLCLVRPVQKREGEDTASAAAADENVSMRDSFIWLSSLLPNQSPSDKTRSKNSCSHKNCSDNSGDANIKDEYQV